MTPMMEAPLEFWICVPDHLRLGSGRVFLTQPPAGDDRRDQLAELQRVPRVLHHRRRAQTLRRLQSRWGSALEEEVGSLWGGPGAIRRKMDARSRKGGQGG